MITERLIKLREEKKLNKKVIAEFLKIDQSTYGKYELGKRQPDYNTLIKLADFYEVSVDYLLGRTCMKNSSNSKAETNASHNLDISSLPDEAIKQVEDYIDYIKQKYNPDGNLKK
ncbi:MAG: putative transcriptional regulator [Neobacillus sp.]|jgi:transcriptional regulator with XRE-family HTH domain|nr:putative transcriptional regulator [Neobacillus sp.]